MKAHVEPFRVAALDWFDAGWHPIPLSGRTKIPRAEARDYTGRYGADATRTKVENWTRALCTRRGNIGLRLADGLIGIDVDHYDEKRGGDELRDLERKHGPLPATVVITARTDGVSGIRFFGVPSGLKFKSQPTDSIEVIQRHHRYVVAPPSIHAKTGNRYRVYLPGARHSSLDPVAPAALPALPDAWVTALSLGAYDADGPAADLSTGAVVAWLQERNAPDAEPCRAMADHRDRALVRLRRNGGAHDIATGSAQTLVNLARDGHIGVNTALAAVRDAFLGVLEKRGDRTRRRQAATEWDRAVHSAVARVVGELAEDGLTPETECYCPFNFPTGWGQNVPGLSKRHDTADYYADQLATAGLSSNQVDRLTARLRERGL